MSTSDNKSTVRRGWGGGREPERLQNPHPCSGLEFVYKAHGIFTSLRPAERWHSSRVGRGESSFHVTSTQCLWAERCLPSKQLATRYRDGCFFARRLCNIRQGPRGPWRKDTRSSTSAPSQPRHNRPCINHCASINEAKDFQSQKSHFPGLSVKSCRCPRFEKLTPHPAH